MRCKACDNVMTPNEIIFYPDRVEFEEFCSRCKQQHYTDEYKEDGELWVPDDSEGDAQP
jgi:hypothetical protein